MNDSLASALRFRLAWCPVAVALLLVGCGQSASQTSAAEFIYDGGDYSWSSSSIQQTVLKPLTINPGDNTLSYETWTSATNGWGPIERDRSNGGRVQGDGNPLTLGGQTSARGLGVHANSSMTFSLAGQCQTFTANVGVDDEVGTQGSVVFQVLADGELLFDSGRLTGKDPGRAVSVSVAGKQQLTLKVTDAGDGINYDHADWADPMLRSCTPASTGTPSTIRISAGGPPQSVNGVTWQGCQSVSACNGYVTGGFPYSEKDTILNPVAPANEALYQSEWTGGQTNGVPAGEVAFAFRVPVVNGNYQVRLHFAELNKFAPGQRLFDVNLEGGPAELTNFDIFQEAGGADRAIVRTLPVSVTDGQLDLEFIRQVENAKVSAIEILPGTPTPPPSQGQEIDLEGGEQVFSGVVNTTSAPQSTAIRNTGTAPLRVSSVTLTGTNAAAFRLINPPAAPLTLQPGQSLDVQTSFAPGTASGSLRAAVQVASDDADEPLSSVNLYGLSARGIEGNFEPPLQQIVQTLGYNINVGGSGLILGTQPTPIGDEVAAPLFSKAGPGPVTIRPVARYSPDDLLPFGYYTPDSAGPTLRELGVLARGAYQTLNPPMVPGGQNSFDPGSAAFGLYAGRTSYAAQNSYTQDQLNTGANKHAARIYPLKDRAGQPVANSFLVAFEPAVNGDYQDYVFVVGNVKPVAPATTTTISWGTRADSPLQVYEAQGASVNGRLYVFGGFFNGLQATARAQVYDPATDRWAAVANMPEPLTHGGVAVDGTAVYVAGGFVGNHPGPQTSHVWKYDTLGNSWSKMPDLPAARGGGALVRLGRELHFFGGVEREPGNTTLYRLDSADHWVLKLDGGTSWTGAAPMPNPRNHMAGVELGGKLYAIGGQHLGDEDNGNQNSVQMYDPATDTWTARASLPRPLSHTSASTVVWNGRIVVVGGVTQQSAEVANVTEYDPLTNTWTELTPLPSARQSPIAEVINNRLVVTTGWLPDSARTTTWIGTR